MAIRKSKLESYCVADAVSQAMSELEQLRDEVTEWYDNLPENFQNGDKGDQLQEVISALENVDSISVPSAIEDSAEADDPTTLGNVGGLRFDYPVRTKRRQSRNDRCGEACGLLRGALDAIGNELALYEQEDVDQYAETRDEIESFVSELESLCDDAEGVTFPGMYG